MLRIAGHTRMSVIMVTLICLPAGIILPALASYIDMINLPAGVKCATGSVSFMFFGMFITFTVIPASLIIFSIIAYYRRKKLNAGI
jgi:hypothetical protein